MWKTINRMCAFGFKGRLFATKLLNTHIFVSIKKIFTTLLQLSLRLLQIEELISETTQSSKSCIREALALILKELRVSDSHASALCGALRRWAQALSAALLDRRDLRQLLFLIHQLAR